MTRTTAVEGKTALHNAAFNGNSGVVVLLLDRLRDLLLRRRLVDPSADGREGGRQSENGGVATAAAACRDSGQKHAPRQGFRYCTVQEERGSDFFLPDRLSLGPAHRIKTLSFSLATSESKVAVHEVHGLALAASPLAAEARNFLPVALPPSRLLLPFFVSARLVFPLCRPVDLASSDAPFRRVPLHRSFRKRGRADDGTGPGPGPGWFHPFRDFVRRRDRQGYTARELALQVSQVAV